MYNGNIYNIYSNHKDLKSEYNTKKIVLNNVNDLMNIPIQQLRTAQLKNFCGTLFDQLYEEAMDIEHNQEFKSQKKPISNSLRFNKNEKKYSDKGFRNGNIKPLFHKLIKKEDTIKKGNHIKNNNNNINTKINGNGNKIKSNSSGKTKIIKIIKKKIKPKKLNESDLNIKINYNLNINSNNSIKKTNNIHTEQNKKVNNISTNINSLLFGNNNEKNISSKFNDIKLNKIIFSIKYDTRFGEEVGILGSIPILGNWKQNDIFYLKWNNGNIWTGEILIEKIPMDFEFKFVISFNRYVKKWEAGDNNKVTFEKLLNEIKYKKNGYFNKYEYRYDSAKGELLLLCRWE
jgi:hypothetical protein